MAHTRTRATRRGAFAREGFVYRQPRAIRHPPDRKNFAFAPKGMKFTTSYFSTRFSLSVERMSRLIRDGTAKPVLRDQILRRERGQGNNHFPCAADHDQDWQIYPVDPYSAIFSDDHTYIHDRRYFQHAHFIQIVDVGKRGAYYLAHGDVED